MERINRTVEWFCLGNSIRSESACLEKDAKENGFGGEQWKWVMARNGERLIREGEKEQTAGMSVK